MCTEPMSWTSSGRHRSWSRSWSNPSTGRCLVSPWMRTLATVSSQCRHAGLRACKSGMSSPERKFFFTYPHARLDPTLFVTGADVARRDLEAVVAGEVGVAGVEHRRLADGALQHRGAKVVDHDPRRDPRIEELKRVQMAPKEVLQSLRDGELDRLSRPGSTMRAPARFSGAAHSGPCVQSWWSR